MRLLILTPEFRIGGGIATFYRQLAPALLRQGVAVRIVEGSAYHAGDRSADTIDGVEIETLELKRLDVWLEKFARFAAAPGLRRHLAASWALWEQAGEGVDADVIEAADWGLLFAAPAIAGSRPLIVQGHASCGQISVHDPMAGEAAQDALIRLVESALLSRVQTLQTYSQANAGFWGGETGRPVDVIRPALRVAPEAAAVTVSDRGLVAGRIQRWKGPQVLCKALTIIGEAAPRIDWLGKDTAFDRRGSSTAAHLATTYPAIWNRVVQTGPPVAPEALAARQASARFNLIPSDWDVFNFTVPEAMASGRPTVVSSGAGASELVEDGETGFLFEAGNAPSLASALDRLLTADAARLAEIGRAARETVRRELDPERIAGIRIAAYGKAISDFAAAPPAPIGGWVDAICRPREADFEANAFLDQFPIRALGRHLAGRIAAAVAPAGRSRG